MKKHRNITGRIVNSLRIVCIWTIVMSSFSAEIARGDDVGATWDKQYRELQSDISAVKSKQRGVSPFLLDRESAVYPEDRSPTGIVLRRTTALLKHMRNLRGANGLEEVESKLGDLKKQYAASETESKDLYMEACRLRRELSLSNPLLDFDEMIFLTKSGNREGVLQCWNYGYHVRPGGGLFRVSGIKDGKPAIKNILENSEVESGRLKGRKLTAPGAFNIPALDYDGKTIVFSYVERTGIRPPWPRDVFEAFTEETCFHLFKVNADGSDLVQVTDGKRNDYDPCFLPNGRVVFVSDRRNIMDRCQGGAPFREFSQPCGTMHSMKRDGSDMIPISYHETTELQPSVDNDGMLVYTRWDYVDRDFSAAHNMWICYPDGRDARAPHGNFAYPHHTFDGKSWKDGRADRPWAEYCIKGIPGSRRHIAVAGKHHISGPWGTLVLIDTNIEDDNKMSQVTLFHNYEMMQESRGYAGDHDKGLPRSPEFTDPWPLSEAFIIAARKNQVYLLDKFGNAELLFAASSSSCGGIDQVRRPIPLRAEKRPPALPTMTNQGERYKTAGHKRATISIMNVYESDFEWPPNTKISAIRVMQVFPYPWHSPFENQPRMGPGNGVSARAVLGVVPVEEDGSAYFEAPVEKAIYFQALDENGMAVQSMRTDTYVHPGEQMTCLGCHEKKGKAPAQNKKPMAMKRAPSKLVPNLEDGSCPMTYARLVEPLLKNKCNPCHVKNKKPVPDLKKYQFFYHGTGGHSGVQPIHGGYRTIAGRFGAIQTGLAKKMLMKHHRKALTMAEINRITLWADSNSNELGAYYDEAGQRAGKVVWPVIDMDPLNPAGIDLMPGRPAPPAPTASTPLMKQSEGIIKKYWPAPKKTTRRERGNSKPVSMGEAIKKFAPGWSVRSCGKEEHPGLRAEWAGRKSVLVTHPLDRQTGCVLSREISVSAGKKTSLLVDVAHDPKGDWTLVARVDSKQIISRTIGGRTAVDRWTTVELDLSPYAGKKVKVELVNQPSGWNWETGYWGSIKLAEK
ncbi:MAG: hypothetical protein QGI24_03060 [Kiritimatiellia bacterium]|jgi:hypothetical protein|nr:hypothetical protein [Kiritimatiellia bacterium]MDP6847742.1 hypothetical protein [Kiritimatiellia bacterium]